MFRLVVVSDEGKVLAASPRFELFDAMRRQRCFVRMGYPIAVAVDSRSLARLAAQPHTKMGQPQFWEPISVEKPPPPSTGQLLQQSVSLTFHPLRPEEDCRGR
jgi:hypothetical protein